MVRGWQSVVRAQLTYTHHSALGQLVPHDLSSITIGITPLALEHTATVAINDFLVSGRETNLGFLPLDNYPDLTLVSTNCDIRTALLDQLRRRCGAPEVLGPTSKGM